MFGPKCDVLIYLFSSPVAVESEAHTALCTWKHLEAG
jgi:hypothetical protein